MVKHNYVIHNGTYMFMHYQYTINTYIIAMDYKNTFTEGLISEGLYYMHAFELSCMYTYVAVYLYFIKKIYI